MPRGDPDEARRPDRPSGFDGGAREGVFVPVDRREQLAHLLREAERDPYGNAAEIKAIQEQIDALDRSALHDRMTALGLPVEQPSPPPSSEPKSNRGKTYDGAKVEEVLRLAHVRWKGRLGRTARDEIHGELEAASTYMIDLVFELMGDGDPRLGYDAETGSGWQEVAGQRSAVPERITLRDLVRSRSQSQNPG